MGTIHLSQGNTIFCKQWIKLSTIQSYVHAAASLIAQYASFEADPGRQDQTTKAFAHCLNSVYNELSQY